MAIGKDKKRYSVTLTPGHVDRFRSLCKRLHLPENTMSNAFDDILVTLSETFETALDKGTLSIGDLFKVMGQQMELLEETNKEKNNVAEQKRNSVTH